MHSSSARALSEFLRGTSPPRRLSHALRLALFLPPILALLAVSSCAVGVLGAVLPVDLRVYFMPSDVERAIGSVDYTPPGRRIDVRYVVDGESHILRARLPTQTRVLPSPVIVEFDPRKPTRAVVVGVERDEATFAWVPIGLILLLMGLALVVRMAWNARKALLLLEDGIITNATWLTVQGVTGLQRDSRVSRPVFIYSVDDKNRSYRASLRISRVTNEANEPLVYDPSDPRRAMLLDEISAEPRLDDVGVLRLRNWLPLFAQSVISILLSAVIVRLLARFVVATFA